MADDIPIKIGLDGAAAVANLKQIGDVGETSMAQVEEAAKKLNITVQEFAARLQRGNADAVLALREVAGSFDATSTSAEKAKAAVEAQAEAKAKATAEAKKLSGANKDLEAALNNLASGGLVNMAKGLQGLIEYFAGAQSAGAKMAVRAVEVGVALGAFAIHAGQTAQELVKHATSVGHTTQEYQKLEATAVLTGTNIAKLERAFFSIESAAGKAIQAGETSSGTFKKMGIALVDAAGQALPVADVMENVRVRLQSVEGQANKVAFVMALFGKRLGGELLKTDEQIAAISARIAGLKLEIPDAAIQSGKHLAEEYGLLGQVVSTFGTKLGLAISPAFIGIVEQMTNAVAAATPWAVKLAEAFAGQLGPGLERIGGLIKIAADLIKLLGPPVEYVIKKFDELTQTKFAQWIIQATNPIQRLIALYDKLAAGIERVRQLLGQDVPAAPVEKKERPYTGRDPRYDAIQKEYDADQARKNGGGGGASASTGSGGGTTSSGGGNSSADKIKTASDNFDKAVHNYERGVQDARENIAKVQETGEKNIQKAEDAKAGVVAGLQAQTNTSDLATDSSTVGGDGISASELLNIHGINPNPVYGAAGGPDAIDKADEAIGDASRQADEANAKAARDAAEQLYNLAAAVSTATSALDSARGQSSPGYAEGGEVHGPGSSTSDSIVARLSRGEFVVNARGVSRVGASFLHGINRSRLPGFAEGGHVGPASGGGGGGLHPVSINFDGVKVGGLHGTPDSVRQLTQAAVARRASSGGRRPSWDR